MKIEYNCAKIICAFLAGFALAIAITMKYWEAYAAVALNIIAIVVVNIVEKHNYNVDAR